MSKLAHYSSPNGSVILPDGYTRLAYIKSNLTLYINTGWSNIDANKVRYDIEFMYCGSSADGRGLWGYTAQVHSGCIWSNASVNKIRCSIGDVSASSTSYNTNIVNAPFDNDKHRFGIEITSSDNSFKCYFDGNWGSTYSAGSTFKHDSNLLLFYSFGNYSDSIKLYSFKIYSDDELIRDFVPVVRKSDNINGLFDLVHNVFYSSVTNINFEGGPKILQGFPDLDYCQVEWMKNKSTNASITAGTNEVLCYSRKTLNPGIYNLSTNVFTQQTDEVLLGPSVTFGYNKIYSCVTSQVSYERYTVSVLSNNNLWGSVSGGGLYLAGTDINIQAIPNTGYQFEKWNDENIYSTRTIHVTNNVTYTATFSPIVYTITTQVSPSGSGTVSGGGNHNYGSSVTLTANPASGYHFSHWGTNTSDTSSTKNIVVTDNATYIAYFEQDAPNQYTVSLSSTKGGTVTGGGTYDDGTTITITATALTGYQFTNWSDGNTSASRNITIAGKNISLQAIFTAIRYTITTAASPSAGGTVTGGGTFDYYQTTTLTATAATGYAFSQWLDGNTINPRTISVLCDATYTAEFVIDTPDTYEISISYDNDDDIICTTTGDGFYTYGTQVELEASPRDGYTFSQWQDGNTDNPRTIIVTGNATYKPTLVENPDYLHLYKNIELAKRNGETQVVLTLNFDNLTTSTSNADTDLAARKLPGWEVLEKSTSWEGDAYCATVYYKPNGANSASGKYACRIAGGGWHRMPYFEPGLDLSNIYLSWQCTTVNSGYYTYKMGLGNDLNHKTNNIISTPSLGKTWGTTYAKKSKSFSTISNVNDYNYIYFNNIHSTTSGGSYTYFYIWIDDIVITYNIPEEELLSTQSEEDDASDFSPMMLMSLDSEIDTMSLESEDDGVDLQSDNTTEDIDRSLQPYNTTYSIKDDILCWDKGYAIGEGFADALSYCGWFYLSEMPTSHKIIFADGSSKLALGLFYKSSDPDHRFAGVSCNGEWSLIFNITDDLKLGWNHYAVVKNGTTKLLYLNGRPLNFDGTNDYWVHSSTKLYINKRHPNGSSDLPFNGSWKDFMVFDHILTLEDINNLYHV